MLKEIGIGAAFFAAIAASGTVLKSRTVPESPPVAIAAPVQLAVNNVFVPTCRTTPANDTRPDPAWVGASFAHDNCRAPPTPALVDGYTASRDQVMAAIATMKHYTALSDVFQRCISGFVAARKVEADKDKKSIDMALVVIENHRITASQHDVKKVADQVTVTINAFNEYGSDCPD